MLVLLLYVLAMSIGHPGAVLVGGVTREGPPLGPTMVGGIAGFTKRSDARLPDGATIWAA